MLQHEFGLPAFKDPTPNDLHGGDQEHRFRVTLAEWGKQLKFI
jgi:hypothetical protein